MALAHAGRAAWHPGPWPRLFPERSLAPARRQPVDDVDRGVYVQCNSSEPACRDAEVLALRKRLYAVRRELGALACKHLGIGPTGARAPGALSPCRRGASASSPF